MIKVEVVFDGDEIIVNGCVVCGCDESKKYWNVEKKDRSWGEFTSIEDAIKFCLEQSK